MDESICAPGLIFLGADVQVFETLTNAPHAWCGRPVQLPWSERLRERSRALIGGVELGNQTEAPGGRCLVKLLGHVVQYTGQCANTSSSTESSADS